MGWKGVEGPSKDLPQDTQPLAAPGSTTVADPGAENRRKGKRLPQPGGGCWDWGRGLSVGMSKVSVRLAAVHTASQKTAPVLGVLALPGRFSAIPACSVTQMAMSCLASNLRSGNRFGGPTVQFPSTLSWGLEACSSLGCHISDVLQGTLQSWLYAGSLYLHHPELS